MDAQSVAARDLGMNASHFSPAFPSPPKLCHGSIVDISIDILVCYAFSDKDLRCQLICHVVRFLVAWYFCLV